MRGLINWVGGKQRQAKCLIPLMPTDIKHYIEPFCGGCNILLARDPAYQEVINDIDGDLVNFWRVVRDQPEALIRSFDWTLCSRQVFKEYAEQYRTKQYESDVQRAHIFYYLNRAAFGAKMDSLTFGVSTGGKRQSLRMEWVEGAVRKCYERIKNVVIECLPFDAVIKRYDAQNAFFFLDPPYRGTIGYGGGAMLDSDYQTLADLCHSLQGRFLMTINDDPVIRQLFDGHCIQEREVSYSVCRTQNGRHNYGEILVANYDFGETAQEAAV